MSNRASAKVAAQWQAQKSGSRTAIVSKNGGHHRLTGNDGEAINSGIKAEESARGIAQHDS